MRWARPFYETCLTHPLSCVLWFLQILVLPFQLAPKAEPAVELDILMAGSNSVRSGSQ